MKRKRKTERDSSVLKRLKTDQQSLGRSTWPLLCCYYPNVLTLRQYLVGTLSKAKKRQRKVHHYGKDNDKNSPAEVDDALTSLLDSIVVGTSNQIDDLNVEGLDKDITLFTQQLSESTATITPTQGALKQPEVGLA